MPTTKSDVTTAATLLSRATVQFTKARTDFETAAKALDAATTAREAAHKNLNEIIAQLDPSEASTI
jgi:hypothetical protein